MANPVMEIEKINKTTKIDIIVFPVYISEPAKMTRVKAIPKEIPIINFKKGLLLENKGDPIAKISTIPKPT